MRQGRAAAKARSIRERLVLPQRYAAAYGEYPAQNLSAIWEQLFRRFAPPNLGQRHFPLYEASLLSMRTIESPFISFLFSLPFVFGRTFVFSVPLPYLSSALPRGRRVLLRISTERQVARSHHGAT